MQTHFSGAIVSNKIGSAITRIAFPISWNETTAPSGTSIKLCTIPASATTPIVFSAYLAIDVANDAATSAVAILGFGSGLSNWMAAFDIKGASATFNYSPANQVFKKAETELWYTQTFVGTPTAGKVWIIVEIAELAGNSLT
jgi:hypothetical protein